MYKATDEAPVTQIIYKKLYNNWNNQEYIVHCTKRQKTSV